MNELQLRRVGNQSLHRRRLAGANLHDKRAPGQEAAGGERHELADHVQSVGAREEGGARLMVTHFDGKTVAIGLETGPRYQTGLSDLEGLAGTGLEQINDAESRWSMPVVATLSVRF